MSAGWYPCYCISSTTGRTLDFARAFYNHTYIHDQRNCQQANIKHLCFGKHETTQNRKSHTASYRHFAFQIKAVESELFHNISLSVPTSALETTINKRPTMSTITHLQISFKSADPKKGFSQDNEYRYNNRRPPASRYLTLQHIDMYSVQAHISRFTVTHNILKQEITNT